MRIALVSISSLALAAVAVALLAGCATPPGIDREVSGKQVGGVPPTLVVDGADDNTRIVLGRGQGIVVRLPSNPSTGYSWRSEGGVNPGTLRAVASEYVPSPRFRGESVIVGRGGTQIFAYEAVSVGTTHIRLAYIPPGGGAAADRFFAEIVVR